LQYALELYKQNKTQFRRSSLENPLNVIKILLENGASYSCIESDRDCPHEIKGEIQKIKLAQAIYKNKHRFEMLETSSDDKNEYFSSNHLKYLCEKSGIPSHLMSGEITQPKVSEIINEIATTESNFLSDLHAFLGILNNADDEENFPSLVGYDLPSSTSGFADDETFDKKKTLDSYDSKTHPQANLFLENDVDFIVEILLRNDQKHTDAFFSMSKRWILQEDKHKKIQDVKKKLLSIEPAIKNVIIDQRSQLKKTNQEMVAIKDQLTASNARLSKMEEILSRLQRWYLVKENEVVATQEERDSGSQKRSNSEELPIEGSLKKPKSMEPSGGSFKPSI